MYPRDLEELVKWWINHEEHWSNETLCGIRIKRVIDDEVDITIITGEGHYSDEVTFNYNEMILTYINSRFEELNPTLS